MDSNSNNRSSSNINRTNLNLINMLQNMYLSNNNLIDRLLSTNNEILHSIQNLMDNQNQFQNQTYSYFENLPQHNRRPRETQNRTNTPIIRNNSLANFLLSFPDLQRTSILLDYFEPNSEMEQVLESFLNPVPIQVTPSQIENSTTLISFGEIEDPRNNSCPICLETFIENEMVTVIKFCRHIFNTNQIHQWFQNNVRCPVCRFDIRNYREPNLTERGVGGINTNPNRNRPRNQSLSNGIWINGLRDISNNSI